MEHNKETPIERSTRSNFGGWGWFIIIFAFVSFMFAGNLIIDSLNLTVAAFSSLNGWNSGVLLTYSTVAGLIAIAGCGWLSHCVARFGVKKVYVCCLAIVGACCMVWGSVTQIWQYVLILILVNIFGNGFGFVGGTAILANWFPKKKGLAMGWATIGFQASAVLLLPAFSSLMNHFNLKVAFRAVGICLFLLMIICILFVKSNPEERGCSPDNDDSLSIEEYRLLHEQKIEEEKRYHKSTLDLLKTKQLWQIGILNGLVQMAVTVLVAQFIPNLINCGFTPDRATLIYSIASVVGGVGSYLWGVLDQKIGVKKASILMCISHALAGFLFALAASQIVPGKVIPTISAFIVGSILGVSSNYLGSFTSTVFGRYGYSQAFGLIYMIVCGLRSAGYAVIGVISNITGGYVASYLIAGFCSILAMFITMRTDDRCIGIE